MINDVVEGIIYGIVARLETADLYADELFADRLKRYLFSQDASLRLPQKAFFTAEAQRTRSFSLVFLFSTPPRSLRLVFSVDSSLDGWFFV